MKILCHISNIPWILFFESWTKYFRYSLSVNVTNLEATAQDSFELSWFPKVEKRIKNYFPDSKLVHAIVSMYRVLHRIEGTLCHSERNQHEWKSLVMFARCSKHDIFHNWERRNGTKFFFHRTVVKLNRLFPSFDVAFCRTVSCKLENN